MKIGRGRDGQGLPKGEGSRGKVKRRNKKRPGANCPSNKLATRCPTHCAVATSGHRNRFGVGVGPYETTNVLSKSKILNIFLKIQGQYIIIIINVFLELLMI